MKKFKSKKIISIDYGTKRVGLAIADSTLSFALPLVVLENNKFLFLNIKKIIDEENINLIILGYPKTLNNYVSQRHELILNFKNELELFLKNSIKIVLFDESYSTKSAFTSMNQFGINKNHFQKSKDMVSACIFLENYLAKIRDKNGK